MKASAIGKILDVGFGKTCAPSSIGAQVNRVKNLKEAEGIQAHKERGDVAEGA